MATNTNLKWEAAKQADSATQASKVVNALTIQLNGTSQGAYNGSAAKTVNITPSSIGAATSGHSHSNYSLSTHEHSNYMRFRGVVANDAAIDTAFAPGYYYLNGGKYSLLGNQPQYGWLAVYSNNGAQNQAITQRLHVGGTEYARLWSGAPGQWGGWTLMLTEFNYTSRITPQSIGAAATNHSHSNYAAKNHGHDNYFQYRGTITSESQFNNCKKLGWWYVNGAKLSVIGNGLWYGKLRVTFANDGTIQQELINAWSFFIRDWSGSPGAWTQWIRIDRPIQTIEQNYGTATISSGDAHVFAEHTINYGGLWLICACSYAIGDFSSTKTSGVFQTGVSVNGVSWLCGNQSLNPTIARPGVGGTIILHLNKGDKIRHRVYFGCTPHGSVSTHYNCLTACNLTQD